MKTAFRLFFLLLSITFSAHAFAQKVFNEGVLVYNISIETAAGEKLLSNALNGAVLTVYLSKDKSRSEMVSTAGTETNVFDDQADKGFILKEYSGQKLMISTTAANRVQKNANTNNLRFTPGPGTTVSGNYTVKKAIAEGTDRMVTVYYDPTVVIANKTYNNAYPQIAGLPVQYELRSGNLTFKYTLIKSSNEPVAPGKFEAPKTGFRVMTYEENQQLKKGE